VMRDALSRVHVYLPGADVEAAVYLPRIHRYDFSVEFLRERQGEV